MTKMLFIGIATMWLVANASAQCPQTFGCSDLSGGGVFVYNCAYPNCIAPRQMTYDGIMRTGFNAQAGECLGITCSGCTGYNVSVTATSCDGMSTVTTYGHICCNDWALAKGVGCPLDKQAVASEPKPKSTQRANTNSKIKANQNIVRGKAKAQKVSSQSSRIDKAAAPTT